MQVENYLQDERLLLPQLEALPFKKFRSVEMLSPVKNRLTINTDRIDT